MKRSARMAASGIPGGLRKDGLKVAWRSHGVEPIHAKHERGESFNLPMSAFINAIPILRLLFGAKQ